MPTSDPILIQQILAGDAQAFGVLVERYSGLVRGVLLSILRRPDEVDDLAQDVFCKAYESLGELRQRARFGPWLGKIARHQALHHLRHREVRQRLESPEEEAFWPGDQLAPDDETETRERDALIWQALDRLAPEERRLVVLYHLESCTYKEIGRFLQSPVATVRWRLLKAERALGRTLGQLLGTSKAVGEKRQDKEQLRRAVLGSIAALALYPSKARANTSPLNRVLETATHPHSPLTFSLVASFLLHFLGTTMLRDDTDQDTSQAVVHRTYGPGLTTVVFKAPVPQLPAPPALIRWAPPSPAPPVPTLSHVATHRVVPPIPPMLSRLDQDKMLSVPTPAPEDSLDFGLATTETSDELDLLDLEDIARVSGDRAVVFSSNNDAPLMGRLRLAPLALGGAGVSPSLLYELAHFLQNATQIDALPQTDFRHGFRASDLLEYPMHFLLQDLAWTSFDRQWLTYMDEDEVAHIGAYLRRGGFLYIEGHPRYLAEMYTHICRALNTRVAIAPLPDHHPLYSALYDFTPRFPGEKKKPLHDGKLWYRETSWRTLAEWPHALGLWGIEIDGELAVLFSDQVLLGRLGLAPKPGDDAYSQRQGQLAAVANIVAYALERQNGLVVRRARPLWTQIPAKGKP